MSPKIISQEIFDYKLSYGTAGQPFLSRHSYTTSFLYFVPMQVIFSIAWLWPVGISLRQYEASKISLRETVAGHFWTKRAESMGLTQWDQNFYRPDIEFFNLIGDGNNTMKHRMILRLLACGVTFMLVIMRLFYCQTLQAEGLVIFYSKLSISTVAAQCAVSLDSMSSGLTRGKMSHRYALDR